MGKKKSPGVYVEWDVLTSNALCSLKSSAAIVCLHFLKRRKRVNLGKKRGKAKWVTANNGKIEFTYSEAKRDLGFTKSRFSRALKELVEKGFIDVKHLGGYYEGDSNKFSISERWREYCRRSH